MPSRRALLLGLGALAGCTAPGGTGAERETESPTADETPTLTTGSKPSPTETAGPRLSASGPDPGHAVDVENRSSVERTIQVTVTREETGEVVFDEAVTLPPGTEREVYNTKQANPDGVESFEVAATMGEQSGSVTIETDDCHGSVIVSVNDSGGLQVIYSIC